jgi:hypothetical protein
MSSLHRPYNKSQLSPADLQKIIDYIAILISIDRNNALLNKGEHYAK